MPILFERHKVNEKKSLEEVAEILSNLIKNECIQKGVFLCCSCRIKLRREPLSLPELQSLDEAHYIPSSPVNSSVYTQTSASSLLARFDAESFSMPTGHFAF